jgi:uncharacterized protein DUF5648
MKHLVAYLLAFLVCLTNPVASAQEVARLLRVSGDRQIAVSSGFAPFSIKAVDSAGVGVPNVYVWISLTRASSSFGNPWCPVLLDEFGFRAFNLGPYDGCPGADVNESLIAGRTDSAGIATVASTFGGDLGSHFVIGAAVVKKQGPATSLPNTFFSVAQLASEPAGRPAMVVEYFNHTYGHYFSTIGPEEVAALDSGRFDGWSRSIGNFVAWPSSDSAPAGAVPVCRFFSSMFTSHFYSADASECQAVIDKWPDVWTLETAAAFYVLLPDKLAGVCAPFHQPVYRLFNNRVASNHRYVTDKLLRDTMVAAGWIPEGYGPDAAAMCVPS